MEKVESWPFPENYQRHKGNKTEGNHHTQPHQSQLLLVSFPNLGSDGIIIPEKANLSFNIELSSTADPERALVSNVGRVIVKKLSVKFEGNEILGADDLDVFACFQNLWKTELDKQNAVRQSIIHSGSCTENCMKLQINASDKKALNK